ncbi:MAG: TetR/AcrR family transcriptional regulator [Sphingobacteriales bacterium]|nr:MAG: TetR/AcrR family transcriptional regulator [Sphingobacteriales bacterium]
METLVTLKVSIVLRPIMAEIETKDRIKAAAHELVMKYGIRTVSMDDIAASVGMSKKTLYQYYQDKEELVKAVVDTVIEENQCSCSGFVEKASDAIHEIFLTMEMMVEMFSEMNPSVLFELQKYHPNAYHTFHRHKAEFIFQSIKDNIERGKKEELYREDINTEVLCRYRIESMFIPFNPEFQRNLNKYTLLEIEEQIILNFLFGMVTSKGYKLAIKYLEQKNKIALKN